MAAAATATATAGLRPDEQDEAAREASRQDVCQAVVVMAEDVGG